ncbi:MAG: hypothetical protein ACOX2E_06285 [Syntrophaceticus sp.]
MIVGAVVVVNALDDIVDPITGESIAELCDPQNRGFLNTSELISSDRLNISMKKKR